MPRISLKWAKSTPNMENLSQQTEGNSQVLTERMKSNVEFYTVLMPEDHTTSVSDLVKNHTPIDFCEAINRGEFTFNEVEGFYLDEAEAMASAQKFVKGLYETAKSLEEKKEKVATALQKKVDKMHKEAQAAMNLARKEPHNADAHRGHSQALLEKIKNWEMKCKRVSEAKKDLQPLEEFEVPKKKK